MRGKGFTRETARRAIGPGMVRRIKRWLGRVSGEIETGWKLEIAKWTVYFLKIRCLT